MDINPGQIRELIQGVNFPIAKEDLVAHVRDMNAPEQITNFIQGLPMDEIQSPGDIFKALNPRDNMSM
jgi:hypothetical protein